MKRHHQFFVKNIKTINSCGSEMVYFEGSSFEKQFEIKYFKQEKHNMDTCEGCRKSHATILKQMQVYFNEFPLCCEHHSKLIKQPWFDKRDFNDLPKMVADKVLFTHHHIINNLDADNWKEELTNYIEYAIASFGQIPEGFGEPIALSKYLGYVVELQNDLKLTGVDKKYIDRQKFIINFLDNYGKPTDKVKTDLNLLLSTYDKWYKIFPFDIPLFAEVKKHFSKTLPLLSEKPKVNPYLGIAKAKLLTQDRLFEYLMKITNQILLSIDTTQLLENQYISDATKYQFDIKKKAHKLNQETLLKQFSKGEKRYIKTIKKWLENEKSFLKEIQPSIKELPAVNNSIEHNFETILSDQVKRQYVLNLLEDLSIISNGQSILSTRKKGALRGVVEALREDNILPQLGIDKLCKIIANQIGLELKSKLDFSDISKKFQKEAKQYIKNNPLH